MISMHGFLFNLGNRFHPSPQPALKKINNHKLLSRVISMTFYKASDWLIQMLIFFLKDFTIDEASFFRYVDPGRLSPSIPIYVLSSCANYILPISADLSNHLLLVCLLLLLPINVWWNIIFGILPCLVFLCFNQLNCVFGFSILFLVRLLLRPIEIALRIFSSQYYCFVYLLYSSGVFSPS